MEGVEEGDTSPAEGVGSDQEGRVVQLAMEALAMFRLTFMPMVPR